MRIVTRPDFDGLVCAALLFEVEKIDHPVKWVEPGQIQKGEVRIREGDIMANLPHDPRCSMWFDHHFTNRIKTAFKGAFREAPSAAGIVHYYYKNRFKLDYTELIEATDRIDSANLSLDEVRYPEKYPYILLSMTIDNQNLEDEPYWNQLVDMLRTASIEKIMKDSQVYKRCMKVVKENKEYEKYLKKHTRMNGQVAITDFRSFSKSPSGNRFLVYSLFPESNVHIKLRHESKNQESVTINVGHSIFNRTCRVNVGKMLANYGGGGHPGAGACRLNAQDANHSIAEIVDILCKNNEL